MWWLRLNQNHNVTGHKSKTMSWKTLKPSVELPENCKVRLKILFGLTIMIHITHSNLMHFWCEILISAALIFSVLPFISRNGSGRNVMLKVSVSASWNLLKYLVDPFTAHTSPHFPCFPSHFCAVAFLLYLIFFFHRLLLRFKWFHTLNTLVTYGNFLWKKMDKELGHLQQKKSIKQYAKSNTLHML